MANTVKLALCLPLLFACNPEFTNRFSAVDGPRVLAVQSSPAQVAPGKAVSYQILVVDSQGTVANPNVDWSFCTQAKPVDELNDVGGGLLVAAGTYELKVQSQIYGEFTKTVTLVAGKVNAVVYGTKKEQ